MSERPLSQYDNLSSQAPSSSSTGDAAKVPFREIRFQFDDVPHKSVISDAKSIFFGLKPDPGSGGEKREENLPLMSEQEAAKVTTPVASKALLPDQKSTNGSSGLQNGSGSNGKKITLLVDDANSSFEGSSPSQAVYMSTTVPQNISKTNISGRHKPTRTSLRHSRMLVMGKVQGDRNQYALEIDCRLLARVCYTILLLCSMAICLICLGILLWAPNTAAKDNPYWSGVMLFLCGMITLAVTEFKKLPQNRLKENYFTFLQINCAILLIFTIFCCSLALIYGSVHFATLSTKDKECLPENLAMASKSCMCLFGERRNISRDEVEPDPIAHGNGSNGEIREVRQKDINWGYEIHYRDLTCDEVVGTWFHVVLILIVLNSLGLLASVLFAIIFVIGSKNRSRRNYTSVRMSQQPT